MEKGQKVEQLIHLSPDEGDEFTSPLGTRKAYEMSYVGDWMTGNKPISDGVNVRAIANPFKGWYSRAKNSHGATADSSVFTLLTRMNSIENKITSRPRDQLWADLSNFYYHGGSYNEGGTQFTYFSINYSWE